MPKCHDFLYIFFLNFLILKFNCLNALKTGSVGVGVGVGVGCVARGCHWPTSSFKIVSHPTIAHYKGVGLSLSLSLSLIGLWFKVCTILINLAQSTYWYGNCVLIPSFQLPHKWYTENRLVHLKRIFSMILDQILH